MLFEKDLELKGFKVLEVKLCYVAPNSGIYK